MADMNLATLARLTRGWTEINSWTRDLPYPVHVQVWEDLDSNSAKAWISFRHPRSETWIGLWGYPTNEVALNAFFTWCRHPYSVTVPEGLNVTSTVEYLTKVFPDGATKRLFAHDLIWNKEPNRGVYLRETNADVVQVFLTMYGAELWVSKIGFQEPEETWRYDSFWDALVAAVDWKPHLQAEPEGWVKHPRTERFRRGADPTAELRSGPLHALQEPLPSVRSQEPDRRCTYYSESLAKTTERCPVANTKLVSFRQARNGTVDTTWRCSAHARIVGNEYWEPVDE